MSRRKSLPRTPSSLHQEVRLAQADHHLTIRMANARLIKRHNAIMAEVDDRRRAITEQLQLLAVEDKALESVGTLVPNSQR